MQNHAKKVNTTLSIKDLHVSVDDKEVLRGVDLDIGKGEVHALLGPNASGKSTLAYAIMGIPEYKVTKGRIYLNKKDLTKLPPEGRAKTGIALAFQNPPVVKNVKLGDLLNRISNTGLDDGISGEHLLKRELNKGLSGGEKKLSELMQVFSLKPKLIIFDELDSGLDIEKVKTLTSYSKQMLNKENASALVITHNGEILRFLKPEKIHVMINGKIICTSDDWKTVWRTIKRYGYEKCKKCRVRSS
ncbi:MAG: ABC transporter ATP-binding protein [Candidatus Diapherotrites archaeon]|nr:ABC transporter ATP-binding protein [Candidatus Diapherotrites archaeon]